MLLLGIIAYAVVVIIGGEWKRSLLRSIHKKKPSLYKEILADIPSSFIEEHNYNSVREFKVFRRMNKILFTGKHPDIISPRKLFWFKIVNYTVKLGIILFIVLILFILYAAFSASGHDLLMSIWGR